MQIPSGIEPRIVKEQDKLHMTFSGAYIAKEINQQLTKDGAYGLKIQQKNGAVEITVTADQGLSWGEIIKSPSNDAGQNHLNIQGRKHTLQG